MRKILADKGLASSPIYSGSNPDLTSPTRNLSTYTDAENRWTTISLKSGYTRENLALGLFWEASFAPICDNYEQSEITATELFGEWVATVSNRHNDDIPITWYVDGEDFFEQAPHCATRKRHERERGITKSEDLLARFTRPVHTETAEPIHWGRLPVLTGVWAPGEHLITKSDFIANATGWTPSPLQPSVSLEFLVDCARANNWLTYA